MKMNFKIIILLFLAAIGGCVDLPNDVIAPKWNADFNIPITNKTYTLSEIIKPQEFVDINPDSSYSFSSGVYDYSSDVSEFLDQSENTSSVECGIVSANVQTDIYLPLPDSMKLIKAVFKEGTLSFHVENRSNTETISVDITAPGLFDPNGNMLTSNLIVSPGNSGTSTIMLNDYRYSKPEDQPSSLDNVLMFKTKVNSSSDLAETYLNFQSSLLKFRSVTGYIPPKTLKPFSHVVELKLGNDITGYRGNIYLTDAFLNFKTQYVSAGEEPFDLKLNNLHITAHSVKDNQQKPLLFKSSGSSQPSESVSFQDGYVDTVFSESNSYITDFVAFLPDEMIIDASAVMNPNDDKSYRTVTENDAIRMVSSISTKGESSSALAIRKSTLKDTLDLSMSQSDRDALNDGRAADISIQVKNNIPLKTWIKISLADVNYNELTSLTANNNGTDSLEFQGAQVNSVDGKVIGVSESEQTLKLNAFQIQSMAKAYYVLVSLSLETSSFNESNPAHVLLKASDWVQIYVKGRINYNVNLNN